MKILIVMDPGILVPPKGYGGIERLIEIFAREYLNLGHKVHLLVTENSYVEGCVVHKLGLEGFPPKKLDSIKAIGVAWRFLWTNRNEFDLVHNFGRLAYLLPILNHPVGKIMTYEREITRRNIQWVNKLPKKNLAFTGCSADLVARANVPGHWFAVHNAIDFKQYDLREDLAVDAPLMFLGRIEEVKGCHTAIKVAKATNNKLIIAGNISPLKEEQEYYRREVEPFIDGKEIIYVGQVDDKQKNEFLGKSKALLFPIEWNEPFGIVMIEAMACGTPVIGFNKGSVDEVVEEGVTGFKVTGIQEMIEAINKIQEISRQGCRSFAEAKFGAPVIAKQYLSLCNN